MGTHLTVLSESYPMNTNMTGLRWFSYFLAFLHWKGWKLEGNLLVTATCLLDFPSSITSITSSGLETKRSVAPWKNTKPKMDMFLYWPPHSKGTHILSGFDTLVSDLYFQLQFFYWRWEKINMFNFFLIHRLLTSFPNCLKLESWPWRLGKLPVTWD